MDREKFLLFRNRSGRTLPKLAELTDTVTVISEPLVIPVRLGETLMVGLLIPLADRTSLMRELTSATDPVGLEAALAPSYAATETACFKKMPLAISIAPNTSTTITGSKTANSTTAAPLLELMRWFARRFDLQFCVVLNMVIHSV